METHQFGGELVTPYEKGGGAIAGVTLGIAAGRARAGIGGHHQDLIGRPGGDGIGGRAQGGGAGAEYVGNVGGENVGAQVQGGGDDGGALLFGVGRGGAGKNEAVNGLPVPVAEAVEAGGHGHGDAVLVKVGYGAFLARRPAGGFRAEPEPGHVGAVGNDSYQSCVSYQIGLVGREYGGMLTGCFSGCQFGGVVRYGNRFLRHCHSERTRRI